MDWYAWLMLIGVVAVFTVTFILEDIERDREIKRLVEEGKAILIIRL